MGITSGREKRARFESLGVQKIIPLTNVIINAFYAISSILLTA
jgi:hypothetical protein